MSLITGVTILRNDGTAAYGKCWSGPTAGSNHDYHCTKHFKFHDLNDERIFEHQKTRRYAAMFPDCLSHRLPFYSQCLPSYVDLNKEKRLISLVAVGPMYHFAVVTEDANALFHGSPSFVKKMKSIDVSKIKHISFGYDDQWAITMKNGHCHGWLNQGILSYLSVTIIFI